MDDKDNTVSFRSVRDTDGPVGHLLYQPVRPCAYVPASGSPARSQDIFPAHVRDGNARLPASHGHTGEDHGGEPRFRLPGIDAWDRGIHPHVCHLLQQQGGRLLFFSCPVRILFFRIRGSGLGGLSLSYGGYFKDKTRGIHP